MKYTPIVLLSPAKTVAFWTSWWRAALPELNQMADIKQASGSDSKEIAMGMTCAV
jgi:hypothetical protein